MLLLIIVIATYSFKLYSFGLQFADEAAPEAEKTSDEE